MAKVIFQTPDPVTTCAMSQSCMIDIDAPTSLQVLEPKFPHKSIKSNKTCSRHHR